MVYQIILFCFLAVSAFGIEHVHLKTPVIAKENVIATRVGVRPYRKTGVRIEAEYIGSKLIVHNYGYGGSGLTLCFGGAREVLHVLENTKLPSKDVAVLGAGVVGLSVAYDLLAKGYNVHIYADEYSPNLTSDVAAGIWTPASFIQNLSDEKKELHARMLKNSESRFLKSADNAPEFAGVRMIASYSFKSQLGEESPSKQEREEVIVHFDNGVTKRGRRIYELSIEGQVFMKDLYRKVVENGADLKRCHLESLEDVLKIKEPIVINCTSMGSAKLFQDKEFIPTRGQLVYFKQQKEIDYLYFHALDNINDSPNQFFVSIYPWSDRLILGGVYEKGQSESVVIQEIVDKLIENAEKCLSGEL